MAIIRGVRPSKKLANAIFSAEICSVRLLAYGWNGGAPQIFDLSRAIPPSAEQHALMGHVALAAANTVRKSLLRKDSEPTAHVAGFGTRVGGLRPSDTS